MEGRHILLYGHHRPPPRGLKKLPPRPYPITPLIPQNVTNFPILKLAKGSGKPQEVKGAPHLLTIELIFERTSGHRNGAQFPGADEVEDLREGGRKGGRGW